MDITVYTNGEQYYYDPDLKKIITKGNLKAMFDQKGAVVKIIDMSLYREQHRGYIEDPDNPVFEQKLFIPYNPEMTERVEGRIFSSDGAVMGGGIDSNFEFEFEKVRYSWPLRDRVLNDALRDLYAHGNHIDPIKDIHFAIDVHEDMDLPTIQVSDDDKEFIHLVRIAKGRYDFRVRYAPNMLGNKHNYDSEGAIKRCNDMRIICSRDNYFRYVKDWSDVAKVFTLGFNDDLQIDFITVINTTSSLNNVPGNSRIASSSRHLTDKHIEFDDMLDYVNTYSNNTRVGRRR